MSKTFKIQCPSKVGTHQPLANMVTVDPGNDSLTLHGHTSKDYSGLVRFCKLIFNNARVGNKRAEFEIFENHPDENEITIQGDNLFFIDQCEHLELFDKASSAEMRDFITNANEDRSKCSIL